MRTKNPEYYVRIKDENEPVKGPAVLDNLENAADTIREYSCPSMVLIGKKGVLYSPCIRRFHDRRQYRR